MLACAFIPKNYFLLLCLFGLMGFAFPAIAFQGLFINEIGDTEYRNKASMTMSLGWGFAELIFIAIGWKWRPWRQQLMITGIIATVGLSLMLFVKETPLYLLS